MFKRAMLIIVFMLPSLLFLACASMSQNTPTTVEWDFSQNNSVRNVQWRDSPEPDFYYQQGDMLMIIKLSEGREFRERINTFSINRNGDLVRAINLHLHKMTLDEAYESAQELIKYWQIDPRNLDEWYRNQKTGKPESHSTYQSFRNDIDPSIGFGIMNSFNDEKPWYINFSINFKSAYEEK